MAQSTGRRTLGLPGFRGQGPQAQGQGPVRHGGPVDRARDPRAVRQGASLDDVLGPARLLDEDDPFDAWIGPPLYH